MLKKLLCYFIFLISFLLISANSEVYANQKNMTPSIDERFEEVGYKSVDEAVTEFENYFNCEVILPKVSPPISLTHKYGRFSKDMRYDSNNALNIIFVNKNLKDNIYKIDIRPLTNKVNFDNKVSFKGEEYKLKNGNKAIYFEEHQFEFLVFEQNKLQYILGLHKNSSNLEKVELLLRIANSVE